MTILTGTQTSSARFRALPSRCLRTATIVSFNAGLNAATALRLERGSVSRSTPPLFTPSDNPNASEPSKPLRVADPRSVQKLQITQPIEATYLKALPPQGVSVLFFSSFVTVPSGDSVTVFSFFSTVPSLLTFSLSEWETVRSQPVVRNDNAKADVTASSAFLYVFMVCSFHTTDVFRFHFPRDGLLSGKSYGRKGFTYGGKPAVPPRAATGPADTVALRPKESSVRRQIGGASVLASRR